MSARSSRSTTRRRVPAVFADRDGTLNREIGFLRSVRGLRLLPGAAEGVRRLRSAGFALVVVTNQSGIARGLMSHETVAATHGELRRRLMIRGGELDAIYFCPHHPEKGKRPLRRRCRCRKPGPGMVQRAVRELGLDLAGSYVVGDTVRDVALAAAVGIPGILVLTGHGRQTRRELDGSIAVAHVATNFRGAAEWIIDHAMRRKAARTARATTSRRER